MKHTEPAILPSELDDGEPACAFFPCPKFVQLPKMKHKSRFTKRFCLFSTVFVDNFVENAATTFAGPGDKVYLSQRTLTSMLDFILSNQELGFFAAIKLS
ncbi:hypothetical protein [Pseudoduganella albidiflava]|uniref:Uncharacterized protein n=1 Tax=Pseudoduganella albidiflava TaxID=321983 RepID=A0ABX5S3B8_9BURK|nr:hypothetical protein [Pseudoduganella albidiflava]QBI04580.1 hypothetical protein EYF70_29970 [Pseudoduganella albidiflava]